MKTKHRHIPNEVRRKPLLEEIHEDIVSRGFNDPLESYIQEQNRRAPRINQFEYRNKPIAVSRATQRPSYATLRVWISRSVANPRTQAYLYSQYTPFQLNEIYSEEEANGMLLRKARKLRNMRISRNADWDGAGLVFYRSSF